MINLNINYINEGLIEDNRTIFFTITRLLCDNNKTIKRRLLFTF